MSSKIMGLVWDLDLPHQLQLILLALADHADHEGENIYPSIGLIAWKTGYDPRSVQRIIQQLLDTGVLLLVGEGKGRGNTNVYRINLAAGKKKAPYERPSPYQQNTTKRRGLDKGKHDKTPDIQSDKTRQIAAHPQENAADCHPLSDSAEQIESEKVTNLIVKGDIAMSPKPRNQEDQEKEFKDLPAKAGEGGEEKSSLSLIPLQANGNQPPKKIPQTEAMRMMFAERDRWIDWHRQRFATDGIPCEPTQKDKANMFALIKLGATLEKASELFEIHLGSDLNMPSWGTVLQAWPAYNARTNGDIRAPAQNKKPDRLKGKVDQSMENKEIAFDTMKKMGIKF